MRASAGGHQSRENLHADYNDDGVAIPINDGTRSGGSTGEQNCYEAYEWWFDASGVYNERFLFRWCEDEEWET